jgi:hypothetical protein
MCVLRVEHRIADLDTWLQEFANRAPAQEQAGVIAVQVFQSEHDPHYIVENLFFDTDDAERSARARIERTPWRIEHRSGSMYELWNDSDTPKFYVGITGEGVRFPRTAPRIDGHSSTSFQGPDAMDAGTQVEVTWHRRQDQSDKTRHWTGKTPA